MFTKKLKDECMQCPRDNEPLKEIAIDGIAVDFCDKCGGVWFDNFELQKFDEQHETAGDKLIDLISKWHNNEIDYTKRLNSPKQKRFYMNRS